MHHVKLSRIPLLRTAIGCRCRKTLLIIAMTRVRRSRGTPWRKTEFQTCELRIESRMAIAVSLFCGDQLNCHPEVLRGISDAHRRRDSSEYLGMTVRGRLRHFIHASVTKLAG